MFRAPAPPPHNYSRYPPSGFDGQSSRLYTVSSTESVGQHAAVEPYSMRRKQPLTKPVIQETVAPAPSRIVPTATATKKKPASSALSAKPQRERAPPSRSSNNIPARKPSSRRSAERDHQHGGQRHYVSRSRGGQRTTRPYTRPSIRRSARSSCSTSSSSSSGSYTTSSNSSCSSSRSSSYYDGRRDRYRGRSRFAMPVVPAPPYIPPDQMYVPSKEPFKAPLGPYVNKNVAKYVQPDTVYGSTNTASSVSKLPPPVTAMLTSAPLPNIISPRGNPLVENIAHSQSRPAVGANSSQQVRAFAALTQPVAASQQQQHLSPSQMQQQSGAAIQPVQVPLQQQRQIEPPVKSQEEMLNERQRQLELQMQQQLQTQQATTMRNLTSPSAAQGVMAGPQLKLAQLSLPGVPFKSNPASSGRYGMQSVRQNPAMPPSQATSISRDHTYLGHGINPAYLGIPKHRKDHHRSDDGQPPGPEETGTEDYSADGISARIPDMELHERDTVTYESFDESSVVLSRAASGIFLPDFRSRSRPGKKAAGCCGD